MLAANLVLLGLAVGFLVLAGRGLAGAWPMRLAGFLVLILWVFAGVWAVVNLLSALSGSDPAAAIRGLIGYTLVVAPLTGIGLAFLAFVKCGPAVVPRGLHALGAVAFLVAAAVTFASWGDASTLSRWLAALVAPVWGALWLFFWWRLKGRVDPAAYAAAPATYKLPFPAGEWTWVIQGNNSRLNHNHATLTQDYAWDFRRPCGTPLLAALGGRVRTVDDTHDGIGGPNNAIEVEHADGSVASYLHLAHNSAAVLPGAVVAQGDRLAEVGSVGNSLTGHIHFEVRAAGNTVPLKFADVTRHDGIPRGFRFYRSQNP